MLTKPWHPQLKPEASLSTGTGGPVKGWWCAAGQTPTYHPNLQTFLAKPLCPAALQTLQGQQEHKPFPPEMSSTVTAVHGKELDVPLNPTVEDNRLNHCAQQFCLTFRQTSAKLHQPAQTTPLPDIQKTRKNPKPNPNNPNYGTKNEGHDATKEHCRLTPSSRWTLSTTCLPDHAAVFNSKCVILQDHYFRVIKTITEPLLSESRTISAVN